VSVTTNVVRAVAAAWFAWLEPALGHIEIEEHTVAGASLMRRAQCGGAVET